MPFRPLLVSISLSWLWKAQHIYPQSTLPPHLYLCFQVQRVAGRGTQFALRRQLVAMCDVRPKKINAADAEHQGQHRSATGRYAKVRDAGADLQPASTVLHQEVEVQRQDITYNLHQAKAHPEQKVSG